MKKIILLFVAIIAVLSLSACENQEEKKAEARDVVRYVNLSQISTALEMYYNDKWQFPEWKSIYDIENKIYSMYMSIVPTDPNWKPYFYSSLSYNGNKDQWYILWAQMETSRYCNISAKSKSDLENILKNNNYEFKKVEKLISTQKTYKAPCYYVVVGKSDY